MTNEEVDQIFSSIFEEPQDLGETELKEIGVISQEINALLIPVHNKSAAPSKKRSVSAGPFDHHTLNRRPSREPFSNLSNLKEKPGVTVSCFELILI